MSKHMRFVVTALFAVILLLTAAITKFYSDTGKSTNGGSADIDIEKKLGSDNGGNRIFEDSSGLYGVIDGNERVVIDPEWLELSFAGQNRCIVSKRLNGKLMTGCIDFEGNVVVPMIYRDIIKRGRGKFLFYTAYSADDDSCVLYDEDFVPLFTRSWNSCYASDEELELVGNHGIYTYSIGRDGLVPEKVCLEGTAFDCEYELETHNEKLLSALDPDMLDEICAASGKYIEFAFTGNREYLSDVRSEEKSVFSVIFPNDDTILSKKLTEISNVLIYTTESDDEKIHYIVTASAGAEIVYADNEDKPHTFNGRYKAVIEFCGTNSNDLAAVSGSFIQKTPGYPKPAEKDEKNGSQDGTPEDQNNNG